MSNAPATADSVALSIVVPCYNTRAYLPRCAASLLAQTLEGIEVVFVNDGSPDGSLELLRELEAAHPGVVRVVDQPNAGLWNARWSGTDVARGAYVTYVDSDDYVDPDFARDLYETAVREDADVVVCGFRRVGEKDGATISTEMADPRPPFVAHDEPDRLVEINPAAWNKCFRRDLECAGSVSVPVCAAVGGSLHQCREEKVLVIVPDIPDNGFRDTGLLQEPVIGIEDAVDFFRESLHRHCAADGRCFQEERIAVGEIPGHDRVGITGDSLLQAVDHITVPFPVPAPDHTGVFSGCVVEIP